MNQLQPLFGPRHALEVGSALKGVPFDGSVLVLHKAMFHAPHFVGAGQNLEAAVFLRAGVQGDEGGPHVRPETPVVVPVPIVLVPDMLAASLELEILHNIVLGLKIGKFALKHLGVLHHEFRVIVVQLIPTQQISHGMDNSLGP